MALRPVFRQGITAAAGLRRAFLPSWHPPVLLFQADQTQARLNADAAPAGRACDCVRACDSQNTDREIPQRCHHARSIAFSDLAAILVVSRITPPVEAVLDSPVAPYQSQKPLSCAIVGTRNACEAISYLVPGVRTVEVCHVSLQAKRRLDVGKIQVILELARQEDPARFDPPMAFIERARLRGGKTPCRGEA